MPLLYSTPLSLYRDAIDAEIQRLFSVGIIPEEFLSDIFDKVGIVQVSSGYDEALESWSFTATIEIDGELSLALPGLSFFKVLIGADPESGNHNVVFNIVVHYVEGVLSMALLDIDVILEVTGLGFFQALVEDVAGTYTINSTTYRPSETTPIRFYSEKGFEFYFDSNGQISISEPEGWSFSPFCIPALGIGFDINNILLRLSTGNDLPAELSGLGFDTDWIGLYCESFQVLFAEGSLLGGIVDDLTIENLAISRGGFSGKITGGPWTPVVNAAGDGFEPGHGVTELFGLPLGVHSVAIEFKENSFISTSMIAQTILPFFDMVLDVEIGLTNDGDFTVAIGSPDGLLELQKPGVIVIEVSSIEFVKEETEFLFKLSGKITPLLANLAWPSFELKGLTIGTDGSVSVEGGWIELPDQKALDFHGFQIEIAQLGFGSDELDGALYKWVGFSGGIQIIQALPLRGGVEGLKVMWTEDGQFKLKIGGVYLSFEIEGVLTFDGSVYFIDEENPEIKEFRGSVDLNLIPINLGIDAQFITGKTSDYNYFYIAVGLDLPVGIPLGPPVLGLYGLAGLYGHNMTLDYQRLIDYEEVGNRPDLTDVGNWFNQKDAMAFGAGLTVGTLPDAKFIVKAKALFVILIPGPVLLIEGHAGMLSVSENFLLRVLAVLDPSAGTFLMNISASYQYSQEEGKLLNIAGSAEAYFSAADPSSWHLYLGEDKPEAKRIRADILNFFKAQTYLMIDHDGLLMGAWIGYSLDEKYGILRVILEAWMGGELGISTMPFQAKGSVTLYGNAELSASMVSLGISVEANVTVEAPKPLYISAFLEVQLKTPLGKPKAKITLKWEEQGVPSFPVPLSAILGVEHRKVSKNWEIPKYSPHVVDADGLYTGLEVPTTIPKVPVVPPDVYLVLNFDKAVIDNNKAGANPNEITTYETVGDYEFKYELKSVTLAYRDAWDEIVDDNEDEWTDFVGSIGDYTLTGYWQFIPNTDDIVNTKLSLNASTPFEISRLLNEDDLWYTLLNVYNPNYPCYGEALLEEICADFENRDMGTYYATLVQDDFIFTSPFPMVVHGYPAPWLGTEKALNNTDGYQTIECLNIKAQEPTGEINLKVIKEVLITAGVGYDSYLKFTNEYSAADIELYINQSSLDLANAIIPVFIHFPKASFGETPYKVWITCIIGDAGEYVFYAFDDEGNVIDKAKLNEGSNVNGAVLYTLEADVPIRKIGLLGYGFRILDICWPVHHPVENTNILVTLPEEVIQAEVHLSKDSQGTIYLYDQENTEIQQVAFDIPEEVPDEEVQAVTLSIDTQPFQSFLIVGQFDIIRVCGITHEAQETYNYNAGLSTHLQTILEETWGKHTAQILEPNKYYRLKIETATSRRKNGGAWEPQEFTENMYFKTGNPPGPPASTQTEVDDTERYDLAGPLTNLSAYIDYTIPAGAVADEAQPYIYRSYDIGVVYNDSYIEQMYHMADLPVSIRLLDNNNLPVLNAAGEVLEFVNLWGDNPELSLTREETRYQDILDDRGCITMTGVTPESNKEILASSRDLLLKPQLQYRAQVVADEMVVHEFAFLTSRYANFMHHIHSFADTLWDHFALLGDEDYQADANVLEQILTHTEEESIRFEQLMTFFDLNPRPLPVRTEITLLNDKDRSYGLLLESPEPLDKERCELSMAFADKSEPVAWSDSVVKIVGGSADSVAHNLRIVEGDYNHQWIDIFLLESYDLSGCTLEYRDVSAGEEEAYQAYYTFEGGSFYKAGNLIRLYNGAAPDTEAEPFELIELYANHLTDIASSEGMSFRLKDPQGEIVYTFILYKDTVFDELNTTIIRNEDDTRLFVFIPDGTLPYSPLAEGLYQCAFTYHRDMGQVQPVLKRFGFSEDEQAVIRFSLPPVQ